MLELRNYQREAIEAIGKAEARGVRRQLVAHATGLGKTVVAAHLIASRPGRAIVLCHRDELIQQAASKMAIIAPHLHTGIVKAELDQRKADVVIASVQSLHANRLRGFPADFTTIIADEAHHATAPTWRRALEHLGAFRDDGPVTVGLTATPQRSDRAALGSVWQEVTHQVSILQGIIDGWLCDVRGQLAGTDADLSRVATSHGDFTAGSLAAELTRSGAVPQIASAWQLHASDRKTLAFTPDVATAYALAAELRRRGVTAAAADGSSLEGERRELLRKFASGEVQVAVNCALWTEGFDEPSITCILNARPTRSRPLFVQMCGRGTRPYPGKADLLVLDVTGVSALHGLLSVASLAGLDPQEMAGKTLTQAAAAARKRGKRSPELELVKTSGAVDLFRSQMRWLPVDDGFVLSTAGGDLILMPAPDSTWRVLRHTKDGTSTTAEGLTLGYAQGLSEDFVRASTGTDTLSLRSARWLKLPPTRPQLDYLCSLGLRDPSRVTSRGQAADLITRLQARAAIRQAKRRKG